MPGFVPLVTPLAPVEDVAAEPSAPVAPSTFGEVHEEETCSEQEAGFAAFAAPLQLCRPSPCHSYLEPVAETLEVLRGVSSPISVVAGVGPQRLGKSTILNMFHSRKTSGFGLGHSLDAQTTGIWIWLRRHPENPEMVVCFADTEGLDTPHVPQSYNWMLSSLALLISNVFLFQSKNSIDASATDRLSTILAVAEQMLGKSNSSSIVSSAATRPAFIWILRDMQLQMKQEPKAEMMEKLDDGQLRKLRRNFREFDCFPLPRPVDSEQQLCEVDTMEFATLRANFVEDFFMLNKMVFKMAGLSPCLGTQPVTGAELSDMVVKYMQTIKEREGILSAITDIPTQAQMIAQIAAERALKAAKDTYSCEMQKMESQLPVSIDTLHQKHLITLAEAEKTLDAIAIDVEEQELQKLKSDLRGFACAEGSFLCFSPSAGVRGRFEIEKKCHLASGHFFRILSVNEELATSAALALFDSFFAGIAAKAKAMPCGYVTVNGFDQAVGAFKLSVSQEAEKRSIGAAMTRVLHAKQDIIYEAREIVMLAALETKMNDLERRALETQALNLQLVQKQFQKQLEELQKSMLQEKEDRAKAHEQLAGDIMKEREERVTTLLKHEATIKRHCDTELAAVKDLILDESSARTQALKEVSSSFSICNDKVKNEAKEAKEALAATATDLRVEIGSVVTEVQNVKKETCELVGTKTIDLEQKLLASITKVKEGAATDVAGVKADMSKIISADKHAAMEKMEAMGKQFKIDLDSSVVRHKETSQSLTTQLQGELQAVKNEAQEGLKKVKEELSKEIVTSAEEISSENVTAIGFLSSELMGKLQQLETQAENAMLSCLERGDALQESFEQSGMSIKHEIEEKINEAERKAESALSASQSATSAATKEMREACTKLASRTDELEKVGMSAADEVNSVKQRLMKVEGKVKAGGKAIETLQTDCTQLKEKETTRSKSEVTMASNINDSVKNLSESVGTVKAAVDELKSELKRVQESAKTTKRECDETFQSATTRMNDQQEKIGNVKTDFEQKLSAINSSMKSLHSKVAEATEKVNEVKTLADENALAVGHVQSAVQDALKSTDQAKVLAKDSKEKADSSKQVADETKELVAKLSSCIDDVRLEQVAQANQLSLQTTRAKEKAMEEAEQPLDAHLLRADEANTEQETHMQKQVEGSAPVTGKWKPQREAENAVSMDGDLDQKAEESTGHTALSPNETRDAIEALHQDLYRTRLHLEKMIAGTDMVEKDFGRAQGKKSLSLHSCVVQALPSEETIAKECLEKCRQLQVFVHAPHFMSYLSHARTLAHHSNRCRQMMHEDNNAVVAMNFKFLLETVNDIQDALNKHGM